MERLNVEGGNAPPRVMRPRMLSLKQLEDCGADHLIDVREPGAWCAAHLLGSYCIPVSMIPAFAGWFVGEGESVALVAADEDALETAKTHLARIGLDNIVGAYTGVIPAAAQGRDLGQVPMIKTQEVKRRIEAADNGWTLIDVRAADEREQAKIDGSTHIYAGHLNEKWQDLDPLASYTLMCASGMRATVAASWLSSKGFANVDVYLGSMGAWNANQG
ncbi:rhodanese-like domain-containing protein [Aurantiacibacter rhizosphaerae]|uniref:rhodanese-like domain-containing protein n=1 Tax=Aurantiacibacter rhizosphaerae TaxID=2691582 RepID=UPI001F2120E9|nr:rhodanese-like domain-containing protein [Aurantiacibacter rhizosphaerae]